MSLKSKHIIKHMKNYTFQDRIDSGISPEMMAKFLLEDDPFRDQILKGEIDGPRIIE